MLTPRILFVITALVALLSSGLYSEEVHQKVAILSSHGPRDVGYYIELRKNLYDAWSLRSLRFLGRASGLPLDEGHWFRSVATVLLILSSTLIFIGFFRRKLKRILYGLATSVLITFAFWIYLFSGVASLNQADMKGGHRVQDLIDVTTAWGTSTDIHWDWNQFTELWKDESIQPYTAVAWMGLPLGAEELEIESWLSKHRYLPILHLCIGANLPKMFHGPLFGDTVPHLGFSPDSPSSLLDPRTAEGREVSWQTDGQSRTSARIVPWGKHWILYIPNSLSPEETARLMDKGLSSLEGLAWGRLDLSQTVALRLDGPGSAINVHLKESRFQTLSAARWHGLAKELQALNASMTIGYSTGWVDDGDSKRGSLKVSGKPADRLAGKVHPSHLVSFEPSDGSAPHRYDLQASALLSNELFDLQALGTTHMSPDLSRWAKSDRRYDDANWYREFLTTEDLPFQQRSSEVQKDILKKSIHSFNTMTGSDPLILIPPGNSISWNTADLAFQSGFIAMADQHLVLKKNGNEVRRTRLIPAMNYRDLGALDHRSYPTMVVFRDKDFSESEIKIQHLLKSVLPEGSKFVNLRELVLQLESSPKLRMDRVKNQLILDWPATDLNLHKGKARDLSIQYKLSLPSRMKVTWDELKNVSGYLNHEEQGNTCIISYRLHEVARTVSLPYN